MNFQLYSFGAKWTEYTAHASAWFNRDIIFRCPKCGRERTAFRYQPHSSEIVYPQKTWPDILPCPVVGIAVSSKVVEDISAAGLSGYKLYSLALLNVPKGKTPTTEYWILEPTGTARYRLLLAPDIANDTCSFCGIWNAEFYPTRLHDCPDEALIPDSWDGSDWIRAERAQTCFSCCSERVIDLAAEKHWTNAAFSVVANRLLRGISFDATDKNWRETVNARIAYEATRREKAVQ